LLTITRLKFNRKSMKYQKSEALKQLVEFNKPLSISNVLDSCMEFFKISYSLKSECKILGGPNGPEYKEDCHIQSKTTFCFYSPEDGNEESLSAFMLDHRSSNSGDSCSIDTGSIPLSYSEYTIRNDSVIHAFLVIRCKYPDPKATTFSCYKAYGITGVGIQSNPVDMSLPVHPSAEWDTGHANGVDGQTLVCYGGVSVTTLLNFGRSQRCVPLESGPLVAGEISSFKYTSLGECAWDAKSFEIKFRKGNFIGKGAMRAAYHCYIVDSNHPDINEGGYVMKTHIQEGIDTLYEGHYKQIGKSKIDLQYMMSKREVQTQMLGNMLCRVFEKEKCIEFGECPRVLPCYIMKVEGEPYYTIEKFLPGKFKKYLNNNGVAAKDGGVITDKMCSFAHWCYQKYSGRILLLDLQGVDYTLTDVAIATWELFDEGTHD
uniref:Uncharacterized protein LOC102800630 n=1 Tax=Saccoglossus kowalevskii TaxID=10224 RepID=A0ABM0MBV2_SACKO